MKKILFIDFKAYLLYNYCTLIIYSEGDFSMNSLSYYDISSNDLNKAIYRFNSIHPRIKSEFFECDVFLSRIMTPDLSVRTYPLHKHSFYELHIPISGKAEYLMEEQSISFAPGKAMLILPDVAHCLTYSDEYISVTLGFAFLTPASLKAHSGNYNLYTESPCSSNIYNSVLYILKSLLDETIEDYYIFSNLYSVIIYDILMHIPFFKKEILNNNTRLNIEHFSDNIRVRTAIQYIYDNIAFPISANDVSNHIMISTRQLNRILKSTHGVSINRLINNIRISVAKQHITTTDLSLSQIALLCGYNSPTHFNLTFKKITGLTPKLYRQKTRPAK